MYFKYNFSISGERSSPASVTPHLLPATQNHSWHSFQALFHSHLWGEKAVLHCSKWCPFWTLPSKLSTMWSANRHNKTVLWQEQKIFCGWVVPTTNHVKRLKLAIAAKFIRINNSRACLCRALTWLKRAEGQPCFPVDLDLKGQQLKWITVLPWTT